MWFLQFYKREVVSDGPSYQRRPTVCLTQRFQTSNDHQASGFSWTQLSLAISLALDNVNQPPPFPNMHRVIRPKPSGGSKDGKERTDKKNISKEGAAVTGDQALLLCVTFEHFQILFSTEVICMYAIFPPWDRDQISISKTTLQQYQALRRYLIGICQIKKDIEIFSILNYQQKNYYLPLQSLHSQRELFL